MEVTAPQTTLIDQGVRTRGVCDGRFSPACPRRFVPTTASTVRHAASLSAPLHEPAATTRTAALTRLGSLGKEVRQRVRAPSPTTASVTTRPNSIRLCPLAVTATAALTVMLSFLVSSNPRMKMVRSVMAFQSPTESFLVRGRGSQRIRQEQLRSETLLSSSTTIQQSSQRTFFSLSNRQPSRQRFSNEYTRCWSTRSSTEDDPSRRREKEENTKKSKKGKSQPPKKGKSPPKSKKFTVVDKIEQIHLDRLAAAFDELARKEGFDPSMAQFADDATFEDEFDDEGVFLDDDEDDEFDDDDDNEVDMGKDGTKKAAWKENDAALDISEFDVRDFATTTTRKADDVQKDSMKDRKTRKVQISSSSDSVGDIVDDMEARIANAKRDMNSGRVSVPNELETYYSAKQASQKQRKERGKDIEVAELERLGIQPSAEKLGRSIYDKDDDEENDIDNDGAIPWDQQQRFRLITNAMTCPACGSGFQATNDLAPGYLPPEKFAIQVKLAKLEEMQKLQDKALRDDEEWTSEDEIEWLIQTSGKSTKDKKDENAAESIAEIDLNVMAQELGLDLQEISSSAKKKTICKRCHGLQNFGKVEAELRPGWTREPGMSQEQFRQLLRPIKDKPAVIIALVDLFDFSGSVLPELDSIAGENNPVILAANKADLLPAQMGERRAENWVRRELEYIGIKSLANVGGAVRLISCKTGAGVASMLDKARSLADEMDCDIYVVGAANAGKSTLLNYILRPPRPTQGDDDGSAKGDRGGKQFKLRRGNANKFKGEITTSPLPGTTLQFIKVDLGDGRALYDTPGLLVKGTLTQLLTPEELKIVVPNRRVEPVTFRVASGKCVLVGGLARIELVGDCKPFLFTFFVANDIKLHPTDVAKADEFVAKHVGEILVPPLSLERMEQLGTFEEHVIDIQGAGWKEAAADISLTGLGWVAVTGAGTATVKISVPKGIGISVRPPLMPFDIWDSTARYTGSKAVRKIGKNATGKRRKGVGRN